MKKRAPGYQKDRGERQQKRILEALASCPMTAHQLSDRLHLCRHRIQVHVRRLMQRPNRRVHIAAYEVGGGGRPRHIYALGSGRNVGIGAYQQGRIVDMLTETSIPRTAYQIGELMNMRYGIVKIYVCALRQAGRIHVVGWMWSKKTPMALYVVGKGENVPRPTKRDVAPERVLAAPQTWFSVLTGVQAREAA